MISSAQQSFLVELLIDCELYDPASQRLSFLTERCGRPIKYMDEIMKDEASRLIKELIIKRDQLRGRRKPMEGQEELF